MNSKNLIIEREYGPYLLDKNSNRHRICPNDGVEFMANHRSRIFCSDHCADEHHNLKKKKEAELNQSKSGTLIIISDENKTEISTLKIKFIEDSTNSAEKKTSDFDEDEIFRNIKILDTILSNKPELRLSIEYLKNEGFIIEKYEKKHLIPGTKLYIVTYGEFAIAWANENEIILTKKPNITWIQ